VAFVDVRDLGRWMVDAAERRVTGAMNALHQWPLGEVVEAIRAAAGTHAQLVEVDDAFLRSQSVGEWMELPLWIDSANPERVHFLTIDASRARAAGLTARPLAETIRATLADAACVDGVGLSSERERELLERWHALV
jgi:2'-hydroxyisoflavone reductase